MLRTAKSATLASAPTAPDSPAFPTLRLHSTPPPPDATNYPLHRRDRLLLRFVPLRCGKLVRLAMLAGAARTPGGVRADTFCSGSGPQPLHCLRRKLSALTTAPNISLASGPLHSELRATRPSTLPRRPQPSVPPAQKPEHRDPRDPQTRTASDSTPSTPPERPVLHFVPCRKRGDCRLGKVSAPVRRKQQRTGATDNSPDSAAQNNHSLRSRAA